MKKVLFIALFLHSVCAFAQNSDIQSTKDQPGTKTELYNRCKKWTAENFRSAKDVIQLDDKENGKIIIKGCCPYNASAFNPGTNYSGSIFFTFSFECKDNKYKYSILDAYHESYIPGYSIGQLREGKRKKKIRQEAEGKIRDLALSFENGMNKSYQDANW